MSDERPLDLSPLDLSPERRAAMTAAILARSEPLFARYAARGPLTVVAGWLRPALAAAALVAAIALGSLLVARDESTASGPTTSEALGFPGPVIAWAEAGRAPSLEELVISLEEASP